MKTTLFFMIFVSTLAFGEDRLTIETISDEIVRRVNAVDDSYLLDERKSLSDLCQAKINLFDIRARTLTYKEIIAKTCEKSSIIQYGLEKCSKIATNCHVTPETVERFKVESGFCEAHIVGNFQLKKSSKSVKKQVCNEAKSCLEKTRNPDKIFAIERIIGNSECER